MKQTFKIGLKLGLLVIILFLVAQISDVFNSSEPSYEELQKLIYEFRAKVREENPAVAMEDLNKLLEKKSWGLAVCHPIAHEIGYEAIEKYADLGEAFQYMTPVCSGGYIHGVLERFFVNTEKPPVEEAKKACDKYQKDNILYKQCVHGIGHGFMFFTRNDLPASLEQCGHFKKDLDKRFCAGGTFMENFNANRWAGHVSNYVKEDDLFYPCQEQPALYKRECYSYTVDNFLKHEPRNYAGLLKWCLGTEKNYRTNCFFAAGKRMAEQNIHDLKRVERLCSLADPQYQKDCYNGMRWGPAFFFGALEESIEACIEVFDPKNREYCLARFRL